MLVASIKRLHAVNISFKRQTPNMTDELSYSDDEEICQCITFEEVVAVFMRRMIQARRREIESKFNCGLNMKE